MRLFVAIDLPQNLREKIQILYQHKIAGAKWVPLEQVHLTLRFIGEVEESFFQEVRETLKGITSDSFEVSLQGLGCFPDPKRARVLWLGLIAPPIIYELQNKIELLLQSLGLASEERPFSPHLTLARLKFPNAKEVAKFLEQNKDFKSETWLVKEFHLYSSLLTPKGAIHKIEAKYSLKAIGN
jgi:RNA 2',3'-cyclic 3'-phosphodiesterase